MYESRSLQKIITVNGKAKIAVEPDKVMVRLEVYTENLLLEQAQQENAGTMKRVIDSLLQLGIGSENMQTTSFTMQPMYDYVEGKQVFRGFAVNNALTVTLKQVQETGRVIDTAVKNGVNRVSDIRFLVENQAYFYKQALNMALEDAVSKALAMGEKMQLTVDPYPVKIDETTNQSQLPRQFSTASSPATSIEPGRIIIPASVHVQFRY
ncbi:SIMPL domain-containing protein [Virgibacillus sp. 179-BFC.A HS]|uniref:SIMPL domain-containing protein n=1 Tax=Tigheibacillus jepli TaxID=3035914 RepID=A0ABU5CGD4_9BACI|nr:SIMPL domain-containing protein [Virgibacillus sp. 179-BFC.A HS]MDY0405378.1 SIMPL domain-containing protein [Virgibacillus sp. 179-BFC.A HS]